MGDFLSFLTSSLLFFNSKSIILLLLILLFDNDLFILKTMIYGIEQQ